VIFSVYSKPLEYANIRSLNSTLATTANTRRLGPRPVAQASQDLPHTIWKSQGRLWVWLIAAAAPFAAWGTLSANPDLTPVAIFILAAVIGLLWRPGEPPVLVFACAVQWLQASLSIFCANYYHVPVEMLFGAPQGETATWLSLYGVLAVAVGIRIGLVGARSATTIGATTSRINVNTLFYLYIAGFFVFSAMQAVAFAIPGVTQLILAAANLKLALIFLLFYCVLEQRRGFPLLVAAFSLEMIVGFLGYFATFKNVFFLLFIAALTAPGSLKGKRGVIALTVTLAVLVFGVFWTSIKKDYRDFLSGESGSQQTDITFADRAGKLLDSSTNFSWEQFDQGFQQMLGRISYIDYFAATIQTVPQEVPYENGALWGDTLKRIVMPRLLFPDKSRIDDSERTNMYTGSRVAGTEEGTSIGIGYMAESYIDFGPTYMFVPILLLGVFYGLIYRYFIARKDFRIIGFAIGTGLLLTVNQDFAASNAKIVGGMVTGLIICAAIFEFAKRNFRRLA
jgi:hypothetical protein